MKHKIMNLENMENVMNRLHGCFSLLYALCETAGKTSISENALSGLCDLLGAICEDFQTDVDAAEDCA